jgi:hypothetical protein
MSLKQYLEERNRFAKFMYPDDASEFYPTDPALLTAEQKTALASLLARDLSPEVLHQDGERRGAALQKQKKYLAATKKDMEALGITIPEY